MGRRALLPFPSQFHKSELGPIFVAEFLGTFILTVGIVLASTYAGKLAPGVIAAILMTVVYAFGHYSKAHYNPCATIAFYIVGVVESAAAIGVYLAAEFLGVFLGAMSAWALIPDDNLPAPQVRREGIRTSLEAEFARVWWAEFIFTFLLVTIIMNVAASKVNNNDYYGVVIGLVVMGAGFTIGPISGAALNPAVAFGLMLSRCIATECKYMGDFWIYWLAEVMAAVTASYVFLIMHGEGCGGGCDCSNTNLNYDPCCDEGEECAKDTECAPSGVCDPNAGSCEPVA